MTDEPSLLRLGNRLAGRYEVRAWLGAGGMGVVYEVEDLQSHEAVALKTLRRDVGDPHMIKREFRALADVAHPNLVQFYDLFEDTGRFCLTMELVRGVDLLTDLRGGSANDSSDVTLPAGDAAQHVAEGTAAPAPVPIARSIDPLRLRDRFRQLARALLALHARGLVHRDVKPQNVRVTPQGRVVLLDFGLTVSAGDRGALAGTISYLAPELADGAAVRPAADWYSFGVLLFEALTGACPWSGAAGEVLRRKRTEDPPPLLEQPALSMDVPADLAQLVDALLRRDPATRATAEQVLATLEQRVHARPGASFAAERPLVGRRDELDHLLTLWRDVVSERSAWASVEGRSGIGKTALVSAFERACGGVVLHGRCYEREVVAYKGIDQVVEALIERLEHLGPREEAAELAHAFPTAQRLTPPDSTIASQPQIGHDRRGAALRSLLCRVAVEQPTLLVLDDVQWADRDCLALLSHAVAPPGVPRLFVLLVARPDAGADWHDLPLPLNRLRLGPLKDGDALEMAQALLGSGARRIDAGELVREAGGCPLEIVERVRAALSDESGPAGAASDLFVRRVAGAAPDVRLLVELTATTGAPLPVAALGVAASLDERTLRAAIEQAQLAGLLRTGRAAGRAIVEPAHDQVRESVFAALSLADRAARAAALAPALEEIGYEAAQVAELYLLASQPDDARRCAEQAATRMTRLGGHEAAAALWQRAAVVSDGAFRRDAERHAADAFARAGRGSEAAAIYRALARTSDDSAERLGLERRAAEELLRAGRITDGLAVIAESLPEWRAPRSGAAAMAAGMSLHAATRLGFLPRRDPSIDPAAASDELDLYWAGIAGYTLGHAGHLLHTIEIFLRRALRWGSAEHVSMAWSAESTLGSIFGSPDFAARCLERASVALGTIDAPRARGVATATAAFLQLDGGSWSRAEETAIAATKLFDLSPDLIWERNTVSVILTTARFHRGTLTTLARDVRRERNRLSASGNLYAEETAHSGFGVVADLLSGEASVVATRLAAYAGRPTGFWTAWQRVVAHALLGAYGHDPAGNAASADALLPVLHSVPFMGSPIVRGTVLWARATLELASGRRETAGRLIKQLGRVDTCGMRGLAELLAGHAAARDGDRAKAIAHGCAAELSLLAGGMPVFAASARLLIEPDSWPAWRDSLAQTGAVRPEAFARIFAPSLRA